MSDVLATLEKLEPSVEVGKKRREDGQDSKTETKGQTGPAGKRSKSNAGQGLVLDV